MALATICPHCHTTFRVASDQLKLRGGIVRCGACHEVFDGNASLVDIAVTAPEAPASAPTPEETALPALAESEVAPEPEIEPEPEIAPEPEIEPELEPEPEPEPEPVFEEVPLPEPPVSEPVPEQSASDAFDEQIAALDEAPAAEAETIDEPVYTLDFDTTFDPFGILPTPAAPVEPEPAVDEEIVALPLLDDEYDPAEETRDFTEPPPRDEPVDLPPPLLMRESAAAEPTPEPSPEMAVAVSKSARRNAAERRKQAPVVVLPAEPVVAEPEPEPESDEPEFVRRSRLREQTGRTRRIALGAGSALLLIALAAQGLTTFRNVLAARYPSAKPTLVAACTVFGCKVELPAQIDVLSIETGELQTLGANTFSFTTLLRNTGTLAQAWPHIELTLTDANDKPLVRRVFTPAEYLPQGVAPAKGFGARSEQPVKLFFELNQIKASGYHIAIFYP
ncbi:MAG TPA: DUF3426 domain-containing protein [Telluria sp.]|nr:DUF3426 domain-containing protein [Telluria sp.]